MAERPLVSHEIDDGLNLAAELRRAGVEVAVIAWIRRGEDGDWEFNLAADMDSKRLFDQVWAAFERIGESWVREWGPRLITPGDYDWPVLLEMRPVKPSRVPAWRAHYNFPYSFEGFIFNPPA